MARGADGLRESHHLFDRLTLSAERDQQGSDLSVSGFSAQDLDHVVAGFVTSERGAVLGDLVQGVEDHGSGQQPATAG